MAGRTQSVYYRDKAGNEPVNAFLDELTATNPRAAIKIDEYVEEYLNGKDASAPPPEHPISSQVDGELRELRIRFGKTRFRILYRRSGLLVVLLHIFGPALARARREAAPGARRGPWARERPAGEPARRVGQRRPRPIQQQAITFANRTLTPDRDDVFDSDTPRIVRLAPAAHHVPELDRPLLLLLRHHALHPSPAGSRPAQLQPSPHHAWAALPRFIWQVEEGPSSAKRWTALPRKPRRDAGSCAGRGAAGWSARRGTTYNGPPRRNHLQRTTLRGPTASDPAGPCDRRIARRVASRRNATAVEPWNRYPR